MIYLDSSVALAHLLAEDRFPPDKLWEEQLVSSRILECGRLSGSVSVATPR
jgi:hypothetical protein